MTPDKEGKPMLKRILSVLLCAALLPDQTTAVYLAEPVADVIAVTCTAILFATQFRKALHKLGANA